MWAFRAVFGVAFAASTAAPLAGCGRAASEEHPKQPAVFDSPPLVTPPPRDAESSGEPELTVDGTPITCAPELIDEQAELDALEGCEVATTGLLIAFEGADLRPLHALRVAEQGVTVGNGFGAIPALDGLENLERASLQLQGVLVRDLRALRNLRSLATGSSTQFPGHLSILDCPNLESLDGLGALEVDGVYMEIVGNPQLQSLAPLTLLPRVGTITLQQNPALLDLEAVRAMEQTERLVLRDMPQTTLDDFSNLREADLVEITQNGALTDLGGIAGLESFWGLSVIHNASLRVMHEFPLLNEARSIWILDNPELETIQGFPVLRALGNRDSDGTGELSIKENPKLASIEAWPSLEVTDTLEITENAALETVKFAALSSVEGRLMVTSNPLLTPETISALEAISTPYRKLAGNETAPVLANPCPWLQDGVCDEVPEGALCAPGTDRPDCSPGL